MFKSKNDPIKLREMMPPGKRIDITDAMIKAASDLFPDADNFDILDIALFMAVTMFTKLNRVINDKQKRFFAHEFGKLVESQTLKMMKEL